MVNSTMCLQEGPIAMLLHVAGRQNLPPGGLAPLEDQALHSFCVTQH